MAKIAIHVAMTADALQTKHVQTMERATTARQIPAEMQYVTPQEGKTAVTAVKTVAARRGKTAVMKDLEPVVTSVTATVIVMGKKTAATATTTADVVMANRARMMAWEIMTVR